MKVRELIELLEKHEAAYGPDSQITVPRFLTFDCCGADVYIEMSGIWTVLTSKGDEILW